jgi:hypothetical protein
MGIDVNALRSFLVQSPKPAKILVTSGDGSEKEILPPKGVGGITWAGVARSIETLDPAKVELFDGEDKLIRAQRFDAQPPEAEAALPEILKRDAESARLALFAQLLAGAYKFSVDTAFSRMVELTERLDERQARTEMRLERVELMYRKAMQQQIDDALEDAHAAARDADEAASSSQAGDPLTAFMESFVAARHARAAAGQQGATTPAAAEGEAGPTNGRAQTNGRKRR